MWLGKRYIPFVLNIIWGGVSMLGLVNIIWWVQTIVVATCITNLTIILVDAGGCLQHPCQHQLQGNMQEYINTPTQGGVVLNITSYYYSRCGC